jgi:hypothetical protein
MVQGSWKNRAFPPGRRPYGPEAGQGEVPPLRGSVFKAFAGARGLKDEAQSIRHGAWIKARWEVGRDGREGEKMRRARRLALRVHWVTTLRCHLS